MSLKRRSIIRSLLIVLTVVCATLTSHAQAVTPTPDQIEQFKQLPRAEQERLARQFGVDMNALGSSTTTTPGLAEPVSQNLQRKAVAPYLPTDANTVMQNEPNKTGALDPATSENPRTKLRAFGYDLFQDNSNAFMPAVDVPVPADYVVGPGDNFVVQLYGKENASYALEVTREGAVQFPGVGPISLAGLKFSQAQSLLNRTVSEQMIGVKSAVTMGALRTIRVFVLGEVVQPGSYVVGSLSTMTNALFASGGIASIGSLRNIQIKRQGKLVSTLDLYDLLLMGDTRADVRLQPGDVIFVPPIGATVAIDGEVRRPAIYEIKTEKNMADMLRVAGGLKPTAYPEVSRVERIDGKGNRTVLDIDLASSNGKNQSIRNGDLIRIYSVLDMKENVVTVEGHVKRPGLMSWKAGMRVSDALRGIEDLLPSPDLNAALIQREMEPTRELNVFTFNLGRALMNPGGPDDLLLQSRDTVTVFNLESDRSELLKPVIDRLRTQANRANRQKIVNVAGEVRFPGSYPLAASMTAQQLVDLAGGLTQNAYNLDAEITRYTLDDQQRQQVNHVDLQLAQASQQLMLEDDNLNIRRLPDWAPEETIELTGEVMFPGKYTIRRGETLSQILQRAGGLTDQAYPQGAVFSRKELQALEAQRLIEVRQKLEKEIAAANIEQQEAVEKVDTQDAEQLLESIEKVRPLGRMVIDLPLIIKDPSRQDVRIVDGDSLHVPQIKQSVTVVGEVQFPTSHLYQSKLGVEDYIERSGGANLKADKSRVYVVKANGRVFLPKKSNWFSSDSVDVEPGDTVVVPLDAERIKSLTLWTSVSQVFYQIALGAAAVASF